MRYFFFYGTLMAGSDNPVARAVHARLRDAGPATATGALHAVPDSEGWYPALLPGAASVRGHLYEIAPDFTAEDLARADAYENVDPQDEAGSLYRRTEITVDRRDGGAVEAEAYFFNQPLPAGSRSIEDGDFRAWLAREGVPAFKGTR